MFTIVLYLDLLLLTGSFASKEPEWWAKEIQWADEEVKEGDEQYSSPNPVHQDPPAFLAAAKFYQIKKTNDEIMCGVILHEFQTFQSQRVVIILC